jgi:hypothetical protein
MISRRALFSATVLASALALVRLTAMARGLPARLLQNGNIYYVATTGSDSNPGTESQPWRSIQKAANTLVAGDTVYIRGGTYNEQLVPQNSGTSSGYITYASYPGETAILDGTGISLGGGLVYIEGKSYIRVTGLRIVDSARAGIYVHTSDNIVIEHNYTYSTAKSGVGIWSSSNVIVDGNDIELMCNPIELCSEENISIAQGSHEVEVRNNHVHDGPDIPSGFPGGEGINVKDGSYNVRIYNNVVHDLQKLAFGVDAWQHYTHDVEYFGNVAYNCKYGIVISSERGGQVENVNVYNNISYNNTRAGLAIPHWSGTTDGLKKNVQFINNTSYNNGYGFLNQSSLSENVVVRNNIFSQNGTNISIVSGAVAQTTVDHNLFHGAGGSGGDDPVIGDPLFVNASGADFHLQIDSPAIDAGSSLNAPNTDFDGIPRPQGAGYDIGAYEYASVTLMARARETTAYLSWITHPSLDPAGYRIYYASETGGSANEGESPIDVPNPDQTAFQLTGLTMYSLYTVWVEPYSGDGDPLPESNHVIILPTDIINYLPLTLRT